MSEGTHRCGVEGCPNLAAYEVIHYSFDRAEGAVVFAQDESCPYICVEHAIDNERYSDGEKAPDAVVDYPYTNPLRLVRRELGISPRRDRCAPRCA
jgi:hypothetical protein